MSMKIRSLFRFPFLAGVFLAGVCTLTVSQATVKASESAEEVPDSITIMTPLYSETSLKKFFEEEYPQIRLDILSYPEDQYYTILKSRLSTTQAADIIDVQLDYAGPNGVKELGPAGYLYPLYKISENSSDGNEENLLVSEGNVYGKAQLKMTLGLTYNKSVFEKYGLSYPECWEDFLDCCEKLKEYGIQPLVIEGHNKSSFQYPLYQIAANQLYPYFAEYDSKLRSGTAKFTDPGTWDHIFETYISLFEQNYISKECLTYNMEEASAQLLNGNAAMMFDTSLNYNSYINTDSLRNTFYFAPFPANHRGEQLYASESYVGGLSISAASEYTVFLKNVLVNYNNKLQQYNNSKRTAFSDEKFSDLPVFPFCNQEWPNEVEIVMEYQLSSYLSGATESISDITGAMQAEIEK